LLSGPNMSGKSIYLRQVQKINVVLSLLSDLIPFLGSIETKFCVNTFNQIRPWIICKLILFLGLKKMLQVALITILAHCGCWCGHHISLIFNELLHLLFVVHIKKVLQSSKQILMKN
jgi:putative Mn2+ efflux pump MntP